MLAERKGDDGAVVSDVRDHPPVRAVDGAFSRGGGAQVAARVDHAEEAVAAVI